MYELSIGKKSFWHGYLSALEQQEHLPLFWAEEERTAASWVASRAFGVDSFHGMSMVPLADIFNHKAAIVQLSDEYIIEPTCYEQDDSSEDDNSLASGPGENRPPPAVTRSSMLRLSGGSIDQYRLEIGICGATNSNGEEVLEIIAASPVPKGQEVHNTYGELGNAELVVKYGFALRRNPFDVVLLDKGELVEEARHIVGDRACRQRCRFLSRDSELLEEDREPFEVLPDGCIGPSLLVALRVLLAADSEFHSWRSLDDALKLCASKPQPEGASDRQQESDSGCKAAEQPETAEQPDMHHHCGNGHSLKGSRKRGSGEDAGCGSEPISEGAGLKKQCSEGAREADNACRDGIAAVCGQADVNAHSYNVIGIDEGQFFPDVVEYAERWANEGKIVIIAALDGTFQRQPFRSILELIPLAEEVFKLQAVCSGCHREAAFTHRLGDEQEVEVVGGAENYVASCRACYHSYNDSRSGSAAAPEPKGTPTSAYRPKRRSTRFAMGNAQRKDESPTAAEKVEERRLSLQALTLR
ncbi:hypothetical protein WJX75_003109 [Coccomyxa subellipsoidea]|uniref:thymidine kinase n=1 Tax=Coccomyxa subellipsoidea TaxID=248742 RepID=A0ABR2YDM9_9CHLO